MDNKNGYNKPIELFIFNLKKGDVIFDRFTVESVSPRGFGIMVTCLSCNAKFGITPDNKDLKGYANEGIQPGESLLPKDFCCRKARKIANDKTEEGQKQLRIAKARKLKKRGIIVDPKTHKLLYRFNGSYYDIEILSDIYGFTEKMIKEVIDNEPTTEAAITIVEEACGHELDLKRLYDLIKSGMSLYDAIEKIESTILAFMSAKIENSSRVRVRGIPEDSEEE